MNVDDLVRTSRHIASTISSDSDYPFSDSTVLFADGADDFLPPGGGLRESAKSPTVAATAPGRSSTSNQSTVRSPTPVRYLSTSRSSDGNQESINEQSWSEHRLSLMHTLSDEGLGKSGMFSSLTTTGITLEQDALWGPERSSLRSRMESGSSSSTQAQGILFLAHGTVRTSFPLHLSRSADRSASRSWCHYSHDERE